MQPCITISGVMADNERLPTPHDPFHVEFDITPQGCSSNSGMAQQINKLSQVIEKMIRYAMLDEGTPVYHPAIVTLINASGLLVQAKAILDGQNPVQGVELRPQLQPKTIDMRGGRA
jgi:hypothetical protein